MASSGTVSLHFCFYYVPAILSYFCGCLIIFYWKSDVMNIMCNSRIYSPSLESLAVYNRDVVIKMTLMNYFLKTVFFDFLMSADKTNKLCPIFAAGLCVCVLGHTFNIHPGVLQSCFLLHRAWRSARCKSVGPFQVSSEDASFLFLTFY